MKLELIKFLNVGIISTSAHYLTMYICLTLLNFSELISSTIGYLTGSIISYFLNFKFTFNSSRSHKATILQFYCVVFLGAIINHASMSFLITIFHVSFAQIVSTLIVFFVNFFIMKYWVFYENRK